MPRLPRCGRQGAASRDRGARTRIRGAASGEITFGIALALIAITVSLLWGNGLIGGALAVGLCVVGFIGAISLLPERRRRLRSKAHDSGGCGGGGSSSGDGDGGSCGGGD